MPKAFCTALLGMALLTSAQAQTTAAPSTPATPPPVPCSAPNFRQLDFWVGEWRVFQTANNNEVASSKIEHVMGDCGIKESWDYPSGSGKHQLGTSYSSYDRKDGKWHQMYIDSNGSVGLYVGGPDGADMTFEAPGRGGSTQRMIYRPQADGSVRQIGTFSADQGKTWQPGYDFTYRRK
jgi:hypothetical protein